MRKLIGRYVTMIAAGCLRAMELILQSACYVLLAMLLLHLGLILGLSISVTMLSRVRHAYTRSIRPRDLRGPQ